ncbi:hypothetical protein CR513_53102, partial [Mucuna pruriens]
MSAIVQDLKMQVGQLTNSVIGRIREPPLANNSKPRGNVSIKLKFAGTESKPDADLQELEQARPVPVPFPSQTLSARKLESDEGC